MKQAPLVRNPELGSSDPDNRRDQSSGTPTRNYWKTFWKAFFILLLLSSTGVFAYLRFTSSGRDFWKVAQEYGPSVVQAKLNPGLIFDHNHSDIVNILLIGRDVNWTVKKVYDPRRKIWAPMQVHDEKTPARSDTMIVVSLDRRRNTIHMISLPRDARVHMPENDFGVRRAKLNAAHAYGGPEMLIQTIHDELGLTIHRHAVIKFEGFKELIDEVGGVEVDVIGALKRDGSRGPLVYDDDWGNLHINLKPGRQLLDGQNAHNYVRFRMDLDGDPGRIKRQQQVMRALAKSMMHQPINKIPGLVQEVRKQFVTDMTNAEIASAADFARSIGDASKIQPLSMFGVFGGRGSLILNKPKNAKLFSYIFGATFDESRFLVDSPWTRRDEIGETANANAGAKAILQRAGLIKGAPGQTRPESGESSTGNSSLEVSTPETESSRDLRREPRLAVADETGSSSEEVRPRRRRARRESRDDASTQGTRERRREPQRERQAVELSVTDEESNSSDTSEETPARATVESQVPQPESESTLSVDSPVPAAE